MLDLDMIDIDSSEEIILDGVRTQLGFTLVVEGAPELSLIKSASDIRSVVYDSHDNLRRKLRRKLPQISVDENRWTYIDPLLEVNEGYAGALMEFGFRVRAEVDRWWLESIFEEYVLDPVEAELRAFLHAEDVAEAEANRIARVATAFSRLFPTKPSRLLNAQPEEFSRVVMAQAGAFDTNENVLGLISA